MYKLEELNEMLIYVADDDEINLKLIKTVLNQAGFQNLKLYMSGKSMMDELTHNRPDLLLLDIMMPGFSGYDVLEWIKHDPALKNIPIIMITAAALDENMEPLSRSFELGAMDYISKPFSNLELVQRVKSALRMEKQRQELEAAANQIRSLEKLIPICSYCKKIRADKDYWQEVEAYISEHTDTMFSHSICPDCYEAHVKPQLDKVKKDRKR
ncbi:MAG: response regulator [Candidatus Cloacimonadaceae bacterium]|jgi:CheY-like chemotaxis protein|nr:response regulator [Candidatus Cloacimonadota bacterium]MCK9178258.1 response regulator [Candidatus Cloacimonadota bacterium]MDD3103065.1 response regulator [Candidatus Cloacimonadota bacterium]MDD3533443.1 response regulator [Candidatus Cloacimonadota bacterium]MDY0127550.1 response regulator [Candidatus Cloacimonadaceae bacterium]